MQMWFLWVGEGEEAGGKSWKLCLDYVCIYYFMPFCSTESGEGGKKKKKPVSCMSWRNPLHVSVFLLPDLSNKGTSIQQPLAEALLQTA